MKQQTADLIERLKEAGEDYEFYPTTKEMVRAIWNHATETRRGEYDHRKQWHLLDIGCGTCNVKRWIEELNEEERLKHPEETLKCNAYDVRNINIREYCVIEKSRVLLERLDRETIVLGTDFHESTLIDKDCDTVFCNPPYSQIKEWAAKFIEESKRADCIVALIPARTDTKWFQSIAKSADHIHFIKGRLKFGDGKGSAPFPSALAIWMGLDKF